MNGLAMHFARAGMGYAGVWDRGGVEIALDHIRKRQGEIHGELVVSAATAGAGNGRLHRASFNVSSTVARDRLAKALVTRSRVSLPWADYLEEFCEGVLSAERIGDPVVKVGALTENGHDGYLIDPLLPEGKASIIYAAGGTGKSYMAVLASVCVASGTPMMGWPVKQGNVLYLDWETDRFEVDERVKRVSKGLGIEPPDVLYRACAGPLDTIAEQIASTVSEEGVRLVIVDSVAMASSSREHGSAEDSAISLFAAFRHIGATVLAIDHVTGEDAGREGAVHKPYGSIYKVNLARSVWELKGARSDDTSDLHLALFHRKVNRGASLPPIGIGVKHLPDSVTFTRERIVDASLVKGLSLTARVLRTLASGAMSAPDLAEELDANEGTLRVLLNRGRGKMFARLPDGSWGLLAHELPPEGE